MAWLANCTAAADQGRQGSLVATRIAVRIDQRIGRLTFQRWKQSSSLLRKKRYVAEGSVLSPEASDAHQGEGPV